MSVGYSYVTKPLQNQEGQLAQLPVVRDDAVQTKWRPFFTRTHDRSDARNLLPRNPRIRNEELVVALPPVSNEVNVLHTAPRN